MTFKLINILLFYQKLHLSGSMEVVTLNLVRDKKQKILIRMKTISGFIWKPPMTMV